MNELRVDPLVLRTKVQELFFVVLFVEVDLNLRRCEEWTTQIKW